MNPESAREIVGISATAPPPRAADVADVLLAAARHQRASAAWIEPLAGGRHREAHRVALERGRREIASAVLGGGLGDAVIARFALLCDLDLLSSRAQTGRATVRDGGAAFDVVVTMRASERGLRAELRFLDGAGQRSVIVADEIDDGPEVLGDGDTVGPYRIARRLGQGGMGLVYEVEHTLLRRRFAMKVLRRELLLSDPDSARRFVREARAAARVESDSIIDVTDFGNLYDGRPYLVMELLRGRGLGAILCDEGALPPRRAVAIVKQVARALTAAHAVGVVHRDLTASNIFAETDDDGVERIKLLDFGAATSCDPDLAGIPDGPPGIVLGTPYYMAPEQIRGDETDARSDLYALGVVFYELLTGDVPFDGDSVREIVRQHILDEAPVPVSPHEAIAEGVERIVARLLRKEPGDRFQSAAELVRALESVETQMARRGWRRWLP